MSNRKSLTRTAFITIALAVLLAVPAIALAGPGKWDHGNGGPHGDMNPGMHMRMIAEHLDLSEEQRAQVKELAEQHRESTRALRDQLRDARRALGDAIHAEDSNETSIRSASAAVAALEADMAVARAAHKKAFEALLTPEQLEELAEMKEKRGRGFHGKGHGPHGPGDCLEQ
jgi:Spy/CpxP family protein refolding chaperone